MKANKDEFTPAEAAAILGIGHTTFYRFIHKNLIPFTKRGRKFFVKSTAVYRVKAAMNLPGDWHKGIVWTAEDYHALRPIRTELPAVKFKPMTENFNSEIPKDLQFNHPQELFDIALKLKSLGQIELAKSAAAAAITL